MDSLSAPRPPFFYIERIGIVNAPPLVYPPPLFRVSSFSLSSSHLTSVLLPVISHPTLPPCIMKFQNVRDISWGTWPTIVSAFTRDAHGMIVVVVLSAYIAVVIRQWRGSKHFCKYDVPSQLQRYLSTAAVLHGRRTHTVDRGTT